MIIIYFIRKRFEEPREYNIDSLETSFPQTVRTSVYTDRKEEIEGFGEIFWGEGYRDLYTTEIAAEVADLDTLYGGLEPMRMGGGHQTNSLRVRDILDREYNFRKIKKDPLQFIQAALYKDKPITDLYKGTFVEKLVRGFYTASHPFGFLAVPTLADAADVLHTNPELYYLPKQPELGKFNFEHGNDLYMIEERPEEHWLGHESFGSPNHDIQSTEGLLDRLRRDEQYSLNEEAYVRARIFDMFLGDWDRHNDQWRWAEIELENGDRIFEPIPRDRDQVFSNFDGGLFNFLRFLVGITKKFGVYGEDIKSIEHFSWSATALDRSLLRNSGKETWLEQARFLQDTLTDEIIEEAFLNLPEEAQNESTEDLVEKVKARRGNLVEIAEEYYEHLAELAVVTATDKDDYIDITRMKDGKTRVRISRNKDGDRDEVVTDKVYSEVETDEIIVYGLDDDDQFYVTGDEKSEILIRLIGGQDNDLYDIENGDNLKVYEHKSLPNSLEKTGGADVLLTDDYNVNLYEQDRRLPGGSSIAPAFGFNPDDGFVFGLKAGFTFGNLVEYPANSKHSLDLGYYSATDGFDVEYLGEFINFSKKYNWALGAYYSSPQHTQNFFGFGNETTNPSDELSWDYNRVRISKIKGEAGLSRENSYGIMLRYVATFEAIQVLENENRFLSQEFTPNPELYEHDFFAGLEGSFLYESYDNELNPSQGMKINLVAGGKLNTRETNRYFGFLKPYFEFFNSISKNGKLVLNTRLQGQVNLGKGYEFYQAARLGSSTGLRGFRQDRFIGQQAFAAGGDLRYSFDTLKTSFLPFQIGIFGGYDAGRVWYNSESSDLWHDSYGGGLWITSAKALNAKMSWFSGGDESIFSFGLGYRF